MIGLIVLIALPLIEIAVLIKVGQWIGFWPAVGLVIATFLLGAAVVGRSGFTSAIKVREALVRGEPPVAAMIDSAMVVVGGVLLMTPGFIADAIGLMLLVPPARALIARAVLRNAVVAGSVRVERGGFETRRAAQAGEGKMPAGAEQGPVIEGEFERVDERPVEPEQKSGKDQGHRSGR